MKRTVRQHRLDAGMRGFIVNTSKRHLWRVPSWYTLEDLIQEGYICYSNCNVKYGRELKLKHFMALVKVSFINHIHDLANLKTRNITELVVDPESTILFRIEPEEATFFTLLKQLPGELQELINILLNDAIEIPMLCSGREKETTNDYLTRLCGLPNTVDLYEVFYEHFIGTRQCQKKSGKQSQSIRSTKLVTKVG